MTRIERRLLRAILLRAGGIVALLSWLLFMVVLSRVSSLGGEGFTFDGLRTAASRTLRVLDLTVTVAAPIGTVLDAERPLAVIHAASEDDADRATQNILGACKLDDAAPAARPTIAEILTG